MPDPIDATAAPATTAAPAADTTAVVAPADTTGSTPPAAGAPDAATPPGAAPATFLTESKDEGTEGDGDAAAGPKTGEADPAAPVVPEEYADFTMPEGVVLDAELGGEFKTIAKDLGLTQDQAQKVAELGAKLTQKHATHTADVLTQARAEWTRGALADGEYGGDKFNENMAFARTAMKQFGTPELSRLLDESGLGNHPEVIRLFYRAGKAISEDTFVPNGTSQSGNTRPSTVEERLYPQTKK